MGTSRTPNVAIVHDWLVDDAGAAREILEVCRAFPNAPMYTSVYEAEKASPAFKVTQIHTSFIQRTPFFKTHHRLAFLLRAWHWWRLDLSDYDIVVSSSGSEAKGLRTTNQQLHINICYTPTHYYWSHFEEYLAHPGLGQLDPLARIGLRLLVKPLRQLDLWASRQPDHFIAISHAIQERIKRYYKRDSTVIFPPVNVAAYIPAKIVKKIPNSYVIVGRHVPYKRIDLAVQACTQLNRRLVVMSDGPDTPRLKKMAGNSIVFLGKVDEATKIKELQKASCFIFPNEDDFGISPVEAMAAGTPVIAYKAGGALDTVVPGLSGLFFEKQTVDDLTAAMQLFEQQSFDAKQVIAHAKQFEEAIFRKKIKALVLGKWHEKGVE